MAHGLKDLAFPPPFPEVRSSGLTRTGVINQMRRDLILFFQESLAKYHGYIMIHSPRKEIVENAQVTWLEDTQAEQVTEHAKRVENSILYMEAMTFIDFVKSMGYILILRVFGIDYDREPNYEWEYVTTNLRKELYAASIDFVENSRPGSLKRASGLRDEIINSCATSEVDFMLRSLCERWKEDMKNLGMGIHDILQTSESIKNPVYWICDVIPFYDNIAKSLEKPGTLAGGSPTENYSESTLSHLEVALNGFCDISTGLVEEENTETAKKYGSRSGKRSELEGANTASAVYKGPEAGIVALGADDS